ncbi:Galactose oxidase/kelch repeat superfamily protein, partial [Prunus dulcis]
MRLDWEEGGSEYCEQTFVWKHATTSGNPPSPHTLMWRELNTSGQLLPPRAGHSTVAFGKNLFVFGGFTDAQNLYNDLHMLDVDTGVWTKVITAGDGPSARFSVAGDCLDPVKGGVLVFIGGCNKSLEALDDMESERRLEKLSLRKQLKLKCQEQNLTSFHDKPLVNVGTGADMRQPMTVPFYAQPCRQNIPLNQSQLLLGKKTFQAKRAASDAGDLMSNGDYNSKSKTSRSVRQETVDHTQADNVHGKESISHEQTEAAAASVSKNQAYSDASHLHKVSGKPDQSVTPLNLGDNQTNDASNFNTEIVGEDRSHRTTDAPNFDSEVMKENLSAIENTTVSSSRNQ